MNSLQKLFMDYKGKATTLIETGTYNGVGVSCAIKAGFDKVISFEIVKEVQDKNIEKFKDYNNVTLITASSSSNKFKELVLSLNESCVFWLDAHKMCPNGIIPDDYPLIEELKAISKSKFSHTVLMDDYRLFPRYGVYIDDVKKYLTKEGIDYIITREAIREKYPKDVLCFNQKEN